MGTFHDDPVSAAHCFVGGTRPPAGHPGTFWVSPDTGVLQVDTGAVWVTVGGGSSSGAVANVAVDYGATGDGSTDDSAAIQQALDENQRIYIPSGTYRCASTLHVHSGQKIVEGAGGGGYNAASGCQLLFDSGVHGIRIYHANDGDIPEGGTDGSWTILRGLVIRQASKSGTFHGIWSSGHGTLFEQIAVDRFSGHGIYIDGTGDTGGNANNWVMNSVRSTRNDGSGVFVDGTDSNAGVGTAVDGSTNGAWGIYDSSFLGNTWVGCHVASNTGGAYRTEGSSNRTVMVGCYSESGEPASDMAPMTLVVGGEHGAGFTNEDFGHIGHATGVLRIQSNQIQQRNSSTGTFWQQQIFGDELRVRYHTDGDGGSAGIRIYGDSNDVDYARFEADLIRLIDADGDLRVITVDGDGNLVVT